MIKIALFGTALATLSDTILAHYAFGHLWVNDTRSEKWQYVREVAPNPQWNGNLSDPAEAQHAQAYPLTDIHTAPNTCGLDAFQYAGQTQTATVLAGNVVGFEPANLYSELAAEIYHYGPASAWLSRAPNDDVEKYDGLGDWFKIAYLGPADNKTWSTLGMKISSFTIPKTTPPGKYLLRFEHLRPFSVPEVAELYINCAHVNIVGPGGGVPSGFAKFPGTYEWSDPGIYIKKEWDLNLAYPGVTNGGLLDYVPPGPPKWTG